MSVYEERLTNDLSQIGDEIGTLGQMASRAVKESSRSLLEGKKQLANDTILRDKPINRKRREIIGHCIAFMAIHSPSASHLRQITAILRMADNLERIGDHAVTIAREGIQLPHLPTGSIRDAMEAMAELAVAGLEDSLTAFKIKDAELAKKTSAMASQARIRQDGVFNELIIESDKEKIRYLFDMLITVAQMKRINDRVKNLCEEAIFTASGEVKIPRAYDILFLDPSNNCQSQLAEAIARKNFPKSGNYSSAGLRDETDLKPELHAFMESKGLVQGIVKPKRLDTDLASTGTYDIIVSLKGPVSNYIPKQPFRSMFFEWDVGEEPENADAGELPYLTMYREIKANVHDMLVTLRGEAAK